MTNHCLRYNSLMLDNCRDLLISPDNEELSGDLLILLR